MMGIGFLEALDPLSRVATAAAPFVIAILLRVAFGRTRAMEVVLTVATSWFVVNVLIGPYAVEMQRGLHQVLRH